MNNLSVNKIVFIAIIVIFLMTACASSPDSTGGTPVTGMGGSGEQAPVRENSLPGSGTPLAVPSRGDSRKTSMDNTVLKYLEGGSPETIHRAVERVNSDSRGMTDQNRVALAVAGELMRIVYPLETVNWPTPSVPDADPYIHSIRLARTGTYDYSAGTSDFLSLVLPSLVLITAPSREDFHTDAERALQRAAEMNKKSVLPPFLQGLIAERRRDYTAADRLYRTAWELDDSCYPAGMAYSRTLIRQGRGEEALAIARELSSRYPSSLEFVRLSADAAFSLQDWDTADSLILEVLKKEPRNADYLLLRARILVERREYLNANALLDAYATTNKTNKNYLLLRARVAREWNRNPAAATSFLQEAVRLYPDDQEVLLSTAAISYQTGMAIQNRSARELVTTVLSKDPGNRNALILLVTDYIASGEWSRAVQTGEQLVALDSSAASRELLVRAYLGSGQAGRAVRIARTLYRSSSRTDSLTGLYLQALVETGDMDTAQTIIAERMPTASSSLKSVLYYHESRMISDPDRQLSVLRSSLLADPRNGNALFAMYQWYFNRSDYRKAQYYLKQVIALEPMNRRYTELLTKLDELLAR